MYFYPKPDELTANYIVSYIKRKIFLGRYACKNTISKIALFNEILRKLDDEILANTFLHPNYRY
jgi:hypothetical protein